MVKNQFNTKIVEWMSDAGGEYKLTAFLEMLGNKGIKVSQSIPYVHQQNGRAERLICTLTEKAETRHFWACLPPSWCEFLLSRREVSARQDAMTYLVKVRGLLSGW